MIKGKSVLALITARGGSKGLPRKNIRPLAGKPLIAWTIEAAKQSRFIDRLILSTDDAEIIAVAEKWNCEVPFIRPAELAKDDTPGIAPVLHAIHLLPEKYDYVVLLQPTSPLRTANDIDSCLELCEKQNAPACVSVTKPEKSPYWMYTIDKSDRIHPLLTDRQYFRRQDLPQVYVLNGAVYAARCAWILQTESFITNDTIGYRMPRERSIDIDTDMDIKLAELVIHEKQSIQASKEII